MRCVAVSIAQRGADSEFRWQELLLFYARPEENKPDACNQESDRNRSRDLRGLLFVNGCFHGSKFHHFFLLVIAEAGVYESNYTESQENDSQYDDKALHRSELTTVADVCVRNADGHTSAPVWRGDVPIELRKLTSGWRLLRLRLFSRPWLPWRPCGGAWSLAESQAPRRSIRPS